MAGAHGVRFHDHRARRHGAENVAYNYPTADAVMRGWLASPGHRANILRAAYHRIGVGCVVDAGGKRWWTQAFAD